MTVHNFLTKLDFEYSEFSLHDELNKKMLASIVHSYLLTKLNEKDEEDWSSARILKDIYECHTCVAHIAQVYVKGIVPLLSQCVFGGNQLVCESLADEVIQKIFNKSLRTIPPQVQLPVIKKIKIEDFTNIDNPRIIDVRENAGNIGDRPLCKMLALAENIPLKAIVLNPYILGPDITQNIILYCLKGYQSTLAADVLQKAGYLNVHIAI